MSPYLTLSLLSASYLLALFLSRYLHICNSFSGVLKETGKEAELSFCMCGDDQACFGEVGWEKVRKKERELERHIFHMH